MKIVLVCNQGMSTGIVVGKMKEAAEKHNVDLDIKAVSDADVERELDGADLVLLGPQIRHAQKRIQEYTDVPVNVIDMRDYGMMNGEKIFLEALELLNKD